MVQNKVSHFYGSACTCPIVLPSTVQYSHLLHITTSPKSDLLILSVTIWLNILIRCWTKRQF